MTWTGIKASVSRLAGVYETGIKLTPLEMAKFEHQIRRCDNLPNWEVRFEPQIG